LKDLDVTPSDIARATYNGMYSHDPLYLRHIKPDVQPCAAGPDGNCWTNAAGLVRADPERLAYVEGMAVLNRRAEPHGYAIDRTNGLVVEATRNFRHADNYRGHVLDIVAVDAWFDSQPEAVNESGLRSSVIWLLLYQEADENRSSRWFRQQWSSLRLRGPGRRFWRPPYDGQVVRGTDESVGPA
jgi:hypothetical protein